MLSYTSLNCCCFIFCIPSIIYDEYEPLHLCYVLQHCNEIPQKLSCECFLGGEIPFCAGIAFWEEWETVAYVEGRFLGGGHDFFSFFCCGRCHCFPVKWYWTEPAQVSIVPDQNASSDENSSKMS